jgi:hypothetical protein
MRAAATEPRIRRSEIEELLSHTLDEGEAQRLLREQWALSKLEGTLCSHAEALAMLDRMASTGGAVAVAATFAKARIHLRPQ